MGVVCPCAPHTNFSFSFGQTLLGYDGGVAFNEKAEEDFSPAAAGGGGGAATKGKDAESGAAGDGGRGLSSTIMGYETWYSAGGGGGYVRLCVRCRMEGEKSGVVDSVQD